MSSVDITGGNSRSLPNVVVEPGRLTLHDLLVVYPVIIAIVKNLSFRQLIALAQTDKDCFAFLRGGGWGVDVRRWNNIRSKCSEICEFSDYHDYFDPIKEIRACRDCKYGVCDVRIRCHSPLIMGWAHIRLTPATPCRPKVLHRPSKIPWRAQSRFVRSLRWETPRGTSQVSEQDGISWLPMHQRPGPLALQALLESEILCMLARACWYLCRLWDQCKGCEHWDCGLHLVSGQSLVNLRYLAI